MTYFIFLLGIVVLGDIMLIPLIYFAVSNSLSLPAVLLVGFLGATISDVVWYWLGKSLRQESVNRFFRIDKIKEKNPAIFTSFRERADKILFISKFLYGIRVPVRVLYGMESLSFKKFLKINIFCSIIWLLLVSGLAHTLNVSAEELKIFVTRGEITLLILFFLIILLEVWAKKFVSKLLSSKD